MTPELDPQAALNQTVQNAKDNASTALVLALLIAGGLLLVAMNR